METRKKIEIRGLFFKDFASLFNNALIKAISKRNISDDELVKKLSPKIDKLISTYEETISNFYLKSHKFKIDTFLKIHFKNQKTIVDLNKESFTAFILYVNTCVVVYNKIIENVKGKETDVTLRLNVSLYGLILRRALQIVDLLISGYVDGAMIMWRSMYENSISLLVLASEDNIELSQRFYHHSMRGSKRKISSYTENYKALKFRPLPKKTYTVLEDEKSKLALKYGKGFLENDYGWADILFKGKTNFKLLEEKMKMNKYRPYYLLCCEHIHSNFNGFTNFMNHNKIILPRFLQQETESHAFIDPMQFTVSILHEVNDYIIWEFSTEEERNVNLLFLRQIFEKLRRTYGEKRKQKSIH